MLLLEALYCSVCSSVLFHFPMTRPICFLQNKDNILLAVETTSYHAAIMKMLSRRKHFTAEKKIILTTETCVVLCCVCLLYCWLRNSTLCIHSTPQIWPDQQYSTVFSITVVL